MRWQSVPIGSVIRSSQYGLSLPSVPNGSLPIVGMKDIQDGRVHIDDDVRVALSDDEAAPYLLKDGDILLNRTNSPDLVGKAGIYRGEGKAVFASYLVRLEIDRDRVDPDFIVQILASEGGQRHIKQLATRGVSQSNLNPTTFKLHFQIPLPSLKEQIGIREVFMAWDTATETTERLIAAKERLLAAMRERLIGSNRAQPIKLRMLTNESTSRNGMSLGRNAIMGVAKEYGMRPMREETIGASIDRYKVVPPRAFAYNPMRLNIGSIAMSRFEQEVLVSPDYVVFECDPSQLLPGYLNHARFTRHWTSYFGAAGNGSVRVRIYYNDLAAFALATPSLDEQRRIVALLDTAVCEIETLSRYVISLRRQKRGLMQKLLTGDWRVPVHEEVIA
ncbi:restriction endonuclease subunit S [Burkholderia pseudomallei]|uniref:restriction endonuclease subunit S n=1 Tax=Burkholderia pseudomallei TaxID=28450 RepID=UPI000F225453|nr:restriction endonuclease subunit S [Burkholderia pseudomallei]CAJ3219537.1 restriction modification system DNA specificity domain-containing protein [Burkholderia pseudomallei]VBY48892.1 restriction modification system DNA specificity domain-containing protein [Burkholderia pseudomallei]VBZ77157.1 restriction modification system DNA specificity domain-containing protein [Burkholderia pseudomallei]